MLTISDKYNVVGLCNKSKGENLKMKGAIYKSKGIKREIAILSL